ncbi:transposable element Tcb2 transposase [Trichonephila clavipes]|nr:transposable element Tcb2 transposase [Trichonephila clavipes]
MCVCSEVPLAQTIFMDDNARPHWTLAVEELLESEYITRMDWPVYSLDLNPIEHVWDALGRRIAAHLHHPENTQQLKQMLIEEWALLSQEMLHQLVLSMRRRCEATIAKGYVHPHASKTVREFCSDQQMQLLPWPTYSPDMSTIEHVWDLVGRRFARDPRPDCSKDELLLLIQAIWNSLPQAGIKNLTPCHVV